MAVAEIAEGVVEVDLPARRDIAHRDQGLGSGAAAIGLAGVVEHVAGLRHLVGDEAEVGIDLDGPVLEVERHLLELGQGDDPAAERGDGLALGDGLSGESAPGLVARRSSLRLLSQPAIVQRKLLGARGDRAQRGEGAMTEVQRRLVGPV